MHSVDKSEFDMFDTSFLMTLCEVTPTDVDSARVDE